MCLDGERVEDLQGLGKVDGRHEFVDVRVPEVVAKDDQGLFDVPRLAEGNDELPQVM